MEKFRDPNQPLEPGGLPGTSQLSFDTAGMTVDDDDDDDFQQESQDTLSKNSGFRVPAEPASVTDIRKQMNKLLEQMEKQRQESKDKEEKMQQQMDQLLKTIGSPAN